MILEADGGAEALWRQGDLGSVRSGGHRGASLFGSSRKRSSAGITEDASDIVSLMPSGTGEAGRERAENCDPLSPGGTRVSATGTTRRDAGTLSIDPRRAPAEAATAARHRGRRTTPFVTDTDNHPPSGK